MTPIDIVVVSYNSRDQLRGCVEPLAEEPGMSVFIVDNASRDGSLTTVSDLRINRLPQAENGGFAKGCNVGWRRGQAAYVLFLNPDARISPHAVRMLAETMNADPTCGAIAPRISGSDGSLDHSQRRFESVRQVFAEAFFAHRLFPMQAWTDGTIRDSSAYSLPGTPDWVSGACLLLRREVLERLDGLDERFFLYCEDMDLCRRIWNADFKVRYEPSALAFHEGGASAPQATTIPILVQSRLSYARKHFGPVRRVLHRFGLGVAAATHVLLSRGGARVSAAHARSLRIIAFS